MTNFLKALAFLSWLVASSAQAQVTSVPANQLPAFTGDCTTVAGAVANTCTKINGVDQTTGYTTYTPTITCGAGSVSTYTTQNGRYKVLGKTVHLSVNIKVNAIGTCSGAVTIAGLPVTSGSNNYVMSLFDVTTLSVLAGFIGASGTNIQIFTAAGGNPTATDLFVVGGIFESN